jgi:molybdopterin converting factor small subunit
MKITVNFYGLFYEISGREEIELEINDGTIQEALNGLALQLGKGIWGKLMRSGGRQMKIILNGRRIVRDDEKGRMLNEGDVLHIFPPIAGG